MKQGTLTLHIPGRSELYWMGSVVITGLIWILLGGEDLGTGRLAITLATAAILILLRLTVLRRWHIRTVQWSLDDEKLVLDGSVFFRSAIRSVSCRQGNGGKDSWILTIEADNRVARCYSLMGGKEMSASAQALKELARALDPKSVRSN